MENQRISYIEIAGVKYPMAFSLAAAKVFKNKYGSLGGMFEKMKKSDDAFDTLDEIVFITETLIKQGCAYLNLFFKDVPAEKGTCFNGERYIPLERETLEVAVGVMNLGAIVDAIMETFGISSANEIELEESGDEKNALTPEAEIATSGSIFGVED